jgi:DNA invertase Pin-like site-specific DNA recombinase
MARKTTGPPRVVGYIRVSTDEQALGPEAQREAISRWCASNGAELVATLEDLGVSGGLELDKRPGLLAALDALNVHRATVLLVAKRDRLARDVMVAAMVNRLAEKCGAQVLSADGTGNGDGPEALLMRNIVNAFAEYERALIRARTRVALAVKRTKRERTGAVPFGYRLAADGVHLVALDVEQSVIFAVRELRRDGLSIRTIAAKLNADGVPARGARWHATSVARLLRRESA